MIFFQLSHSGLKEDNSRLVWSQTFSTNEYLNYIFNSSRITSFSIGEIALYPPVVWPVLIVPTRGLKVVT